MIDCADLNEKLYLYLDSAIGKELKEEIESHLASCEDCRGRFEFLHRLRNSMRGRASSISAPQHLKEEILFEIKRRRMAKARKFAAFGGLGAVALLLLSLALPGLFKPHMKTSLGDFGVLYDSYIQGALKADFLSQDVDKAEAWFREKQFAVTLPRASLAGYDLTGVSLREVAKRHSAVSLYEDQKSKEKLAYIAFVDKYLNINFPKRESVGGKYLFVTRHDLHSFVFWRDGALVNILISDDPEENLLEYARICVKLIDVGKPSK